jgi:flagellar L-ring protein precursor FlgH
MRLASIVVLAATGAIVIPAMGQSAEDEMMPSNSMMRRVVNHRAASAESSGHALRDISPIAIVPVEPREFAPHDLVQIIVRETSRATSSQELEAGKEYVLDGKISAWPSFQLSDLLEMQLRGSDTSNLPELKLDFEKDFEGDGEYEREDDFTARLTAEVVEVLPNGNLVLEARTNIQTDQEVATLKVTGICRAADVTSANTVLSNQLHDLKVEKVHEGELKKASEKGIIAKVLDAIFAF